jgi:membrane-associated phospholipid phosphatase
VQVPAAGALQHRPLRLPLSAAGRREALIPAALGVALPLAVFAALAAAAMAGARPAFDRPLQSFAERSGGGSVDDVMRVVSDLGAARALGPLALVCVLALLWRRRTLAALFLVLASLAAALNPLLKDLFHRARPDLFPARAVESGYGFPSGHAMTSMAIVGGLCALAWRTRWRWPALAPAGLFVLAVGASRVALGVHYPSDVLAGWAFSLAWVVGLGLLFTRLEDRRRPAPAPAPPRPTGAGRSTPDGRSSHGRAGGVR